ncbi:unnamed protein product [Lepeophtheirus salmonis]|uniref:(salmon louse) hypothetical protein n=1 Tax=Lepeophtheirus salmonis TaxID=72036 RepID=A0A7R8HD40_LEPSM|nr:unnamed protein product [Lepeophtheirus salmonis]CAF3023024.1 unnamed protein product [Lepeophtheirus salmonis]
MFHGEITNPSMLKKVLEVLRFHIYKHLPCGPYLNDSIPEEDVFWDDDVVEVVFNKLGAPAYAELSMESMASSLEGVHQSPPMHGLWFHGIIKGDKGGHYQILGELNDPKSSSPEIFSSSYDNKILGSSSGKVSQSIQIMKANPRSRSKVMTFNTRLFKNHYEGLELGSLEAHRGVKADKVINSLLGPSFLEKGLVCYTGSIVLASPLPPIFPPLNGSSNVMECFL